MKKTWKRILVLFLVVAMLATDSSLSEVIYAAGQGLQAGNAGSDTIDDSAITDTDADDSTSTDSGVSEEGEGKALETGNAADEGKEPVGNEPVNPGEDPDGEMPVNPVEDPDGEMPVNPEEDPDGEMPVNPVEDPDGDTSVNPEEGEDGEEPANPVEDPEMGGTSDTGENPGTDINADDAESDVNESDDDLESDLSIKKINSQMYLMNVLDAGELTEEQQKIVDAAKDLYGDETAKGSSNIIRYEYSLQTEAPYKAGQEILIKVNQMIDTAQNYSYDGTNHFIVDTIKNMKANLKLPEGLTYKSCDLGMNTYLVSAEYNETSRMLSLTYNESFQMPSSQSRSDFVIHAVIDGNGEKAHNEKMQIADIEVTDFSADLPVLYYPGGSRTELQDLSVKHSYMEEDKVADEITLSSADEWGVIVNTDIQPDTGVQWVYDENGNIVMTWTVAAALKKTNASDDDEAYQKLYITDPELLQALDPSLEESAAVLQASMNKVYQNAGRTPLSNTEGDDPYILTSKVYAEKDGGRIYPDSLEIRLVTEEGDTPLDDSEDKLHADAGENKENGVEFSNYLIAGDGSSIGRNAPMYSTYKVTAVFPRETFITPFYEDPVSYKIFNEMELKSSVAGKAMTIEKSSAEGSYSGQTEAYPVELIQSISMGDGMDFVYDAENLQDILEPFTGSVSYRLEKMDEDGKWEFYKFYERGKSGEDTFTISSDGTHLGSTTIYLEEGTYRLSEEGSGSIQHAELKGYSDDPSVENASEEGIFTVSGFDEEDEPQKVYINYEATGARILFDLKDKENQENSLAGAKYTLYEDGNEVLEITSTVSGHVVFAALSKGKVYTLKETKAPDGYILDDTVYEINTSGQEVNFYPGGRKELFNESNTHTSGIVSIGKNLSLFQNGIYTSEPKNIANDLFSFPFNKNTFRVDEWMDGEWQEAVDVRVDVYGGRLQLSELHKYQLDPETGAVKRENGEKLFARYRVVEMLPEGYSNSAQNTEAVLTSEDGQRVVRYPEFTVESVFGYGTDTPVEECKFEYYNEEINTLTVTQTLLDEENHPGVTWQDSGIAFQLFYRLGENGLLKNYTPSSEIFEPTDSTGMSKISGLPAAMADDDGKYVSVQWYLGQTCGEYEQIEYKDAGEWKVADQENVEEKIWHLIPFDFGADKSVSLESCRLVMKAALTVYKTDAKTQKRVNGAEFAVTFGAGSKELKASGGNSQTGFLYWVPMSENVVIQETKAPDGYMKGEAAYKDPCVPKEEWSDVTPDTYGRYAPQELEENKCYYNDDMFPVLQIKKSNYGYDGAANVITEAESGTVVFKLYKKIDKDGESVFEECNAVYAGGSYTNSLTNGTLNYVEPGENYYLSEEYSGIEMLEDYIDPALLESSSASADGVVYQDGRAYYPVPALTANGGTTIAGITNYSNTSGQLTVDVAEARIEGPFELGVVKIQAVATGADGDEYKYEAEVTGGKASFQNMQIFDSAGGKLKYTVTQVVDHPDYSHDSASHTIELDIGAETEISPDAGIYDFKEYPRVDVYMQVNWVEDLTYGQLLDEEKASAQERLAGALINVYQKKTDPDTGEYYELIQTCSSNENGTLIARDLEEFESYVFVKAGYDPQRHEEALNPESTGRKTFDKNRYDSAADPVTITLKDLAERYDYIEYKYADQTANSSITPGIVSELDTVKEPVIFHELWMQVQTTKKRFHAINLNNEGVYDGIFRITKNADETWHYKHYPSSSFSNLNQYGTMSEEGDWDDTELQKYIAEAEKDSSKGWVVYDNQGDPLSILYGTFYNGQNAKYSLYRVKLTELTENEVNKDDEGNLTISIDFSKNGCWELMDDEMVTDETGETISRSQVADDGYIYFLVETQQPYNSVGLAASSEIMGTSYVTVYYKSGAEYTFGDETAEVKDINYRCITVNASGVKNTNDYVEASVRPYDINVDTEDVQLNKNYIGVDSNYAENYAYIQFNKWKENKAYDAENPDKEHKYVPVSSAKFDVYLTNTDHSYIKKLNSRTYQSVKSAYSSDAYVTTEAFRWDDRYGTLLEAVLKEYAAQTGGPASLSELQKKYVEPDEDKNVESIDVSGLNEYVKNAMVACGKQYAGIFYISNVVTNTAETPEDIVDALDARKDTYSRWGIGSTGKESSATQLKSSDDPQIAAKAEAVLESEPRYFDVFSDEDVAIGFAQQVAYNFCMCSNRRYSVDYAVVDGFPMDGEGVKDGEENSYGTYTGTYRMTYMHCSIREIEAPAGTFLNEDYKDLMLQSGSYVHRTNGGNWGSFWETYTLNYANTYAGKSNMYNSSPINRTWYYSDDRLINQLGDVDPEIYREKGTEGNVDYTKAAVKYKTDDTNNSYLNKEAKEKAITYRKLTAQETYTGYIPGKPYINDTQAGFTVRVQSLGYPSQLSTYGKTDNELQEAYDAKELSIRPGQLAAEYRLQKLNDEGTAYEDYVYPKVLDDALGHARGENEDEESCILRTYKESTDSGSSQKTADIFTFPQGLGTGVYRLVPVEEGKGTLIGEEEFGLNAGYYDPYTEKDAYRYFTVSRTSADQYVEVFYPELPNVRVVKQENSESNNPHRTTDSIVFGLTSEEYTESSESNPMNIAEFTYLKEGAYELTEQLVPSSGDLTDLYFKENSKLTIGVIRKEGGNQKQENLVGTFTNENGVTVTENYTVMAPVFYGYRISSEGSVVSPDPEVTDESKDATATSALEMATTFQVYVTNPEKQRFQVQKLDALKGKGLSNAEFDIYFKPFDKGNIVIDEKTSNNKVILTQAPVAPSVSETDGKLSGNDWSFYGEYVSNSNGLLMDQADQRIGVYGAPGWYYVAETKAPAGMSYDIADPVLFAFTGTLEVDDQSDGRIQLANVNNYVKIHDSDKVELKISKYFAASALIEPHTVREYGLSLYTDEACEARAELYDYKDGVYTKRSDSVVLEGNAGYTVKAGINDFSAGTGIAYVDYNENDVYYLKETMTADSAEEAKYWIAQCAEKGSYGYGAAEYVKGSVSGSTATTVWKLQGFSGEKVNDAHQVDARVWNTYASSSVKMFKTISTNTDYALQGAEFKLFDQVSNKVLATALSGPEKTDGASRYNVEFVVPFDRNDLSDGVNAADGKPVFNCKIFRVEETKAPAGYQVSATIWKSEVGVGQTLYLRDENGRDYIDSDGITFRLTKYDNVESSAQKRTEKDQGFSLYVQESNVWKKIGETLYTGNSGNIIFPAVSVGNDQGSLRYALKYDGAKDKDAASGYAVDSLKIRVNNVDHTILGTIVDGETYYILNPEEENIVFVAGMTYSVTAYDIPKSALEVTKKVLKKDGVEAAGTAVFGLHKLTDDENLSDASAVKNAIKGYKAEDYEISGTLKASHTFSGLTAGRYLVWETESASVINLDDDQVVWYQIVDVDPSTHQGQKAYSAILKNRESSVTPVIGKTVDKDKVESLMDQPVELIYTITPGLSENTGDIRQALTSYVVKDTGLDFYTDKEASKEVSVKPDYHFTTLSLTAPSYTDGRVGTFEAEVTFYDAEKKVIETESRTLPALNWDISGKKAAAFSVSYKDAAYASGHAGYVAGENLEPGQITVKVSVEKCVQSADLQEILAVKNSSALEIGSKKWSKTFEASVKEETVKQNASAEALTEVAQVSVPILGVGKFVNPKDIVTVGSRLEYGIYTYNVSTAPMKDPVLIDHLPKGLSVDMKDGFFTLEHYDSNNSLIKELSTGTDVTVSSFTSSEGRTVLAFRIKGELGAGEYYMLTLKKENCTVTNDAVEAGKLVNEAYVIALETGYQYDRNQTGNAFKAESSNNAGLDNSAMDERFKAEVEQNLGGTIYGVLKAEVENKVSPGSGLVPAKSEHGDRDGENVWFSAPADVSQVSLNNGTIAYRLSVTNAEGADKENIVLFDVLPYEGDKNGSSWTLEFGSPDQIQVMKTAADKTTEAVPISDYKVIPGKRKDGYVASSDALTDYGKIDWETDDSAEGIAYNEAVQILYTGTLKKDETLTITFQAKVSSAAGTDDLYQEALNRFGVFSNLNGTPDSSSAVYSNTVKAQLVPETVSLSGKLWIDANQSGQNDDPVDNIYSYEVVKKLMSEMKLSLNSYLMAGSTATKAGDAEFGVDGAYQFSGLTAARPIQSKMAELYKEGRLNPLALMGAAVTYRLSLAYSGTDQDLIHLAEPGEYTSYSYANDKALVEGGYSDILISDGVKLGDTKVQSSMVADSDIRSTDGLNGTSDQFFLFSGKEGTRKDQATNDREDIGVQVDRQVTVTKKDSLGNLLAGVKFKLFQYPMGTTDFDNDGTEVDTYTTDANGQITFTVNYFNDYKLVETEVPEAAAYAGTTKLETSYQDIVQSKDKTWIIRCIGTDDGTGYSRLREDMTVTNELAAGSILFHKRKENTDGSLAYASAEDNFQFRLTYTGSDTVGRQAWTAYLNSIAGRPQLLEGCAYVSASVQDASLIVKVTEGKTEIKGLPMGTYQIQELKTDGYVAVDDVTAELTAHGQVVQLYNKDTEEASLITKAVRGIRSALQGILGTGEGTTKTATINAGNQVSDTKLLVNYRNHAELKVLKKGNDGTGEKSLAGAEFTLCEDADGNHELESAAQHASCQQTVYPVTDAGVTIPFDNLENGTHYFFLRETKSPGDLWALNETLWKIEVTVEAGKQPEVKVTGTGNDSSFESAALTVIDKYLARTGSVSYTGTKKINNRAMTESALNDEAKNSLSFSLYDAKPMPGTSDYQIDAAGTEADVKTVNVDPKTGGFRFENFAAYDEKDNKKTFYYAVCENDIKGDYEEYLKKDGTWYILQVYVENDPYDSEKMKAEVTDVYSSSVCKEENGQKTVSNVSKAADGLVFNNQYTTKAETYSLKVKKILEGRELTAEDGFQAVLTRYYKSGDSLIPVSGSEEEALFAQNADSKNTGTACFEDGLNVFTDTGFYYYQVTEKKGTPEADGVYREDGVSYDNTEYYLLFHVEDNGEGFMTPSLIGYYPSAGACLDGQKAYEAQQNSTGLTAFFRGLTGSASVQADEAHTFDLTETVEFKNAYSALPATLQLTAGKELTGRAIGGNEFELNITGEDALSKACINEKGTSSQWVSASAEDPATGTASFDKMTFQKEGIYTFKVSETQGRNAYVDYDNAEYTVKVTVQDGGDGQLYVTEVTVQKGDGKTETAYKEETVKNGKASGSLDLSESGVVVFKNEYNSEATLTIGGTKTVTDENGDSLALKDLKTKTFTMKLTQTDSAYVPLTGDNTKEKSAVTNGENGAYTFDKLTYNQSSFSNPSQTEADFYYLVTEEDASASGFVKNETAYKLHVMLTRNDDGSLSLKAEKEDKTPINLSTHPVTDTSVPYEMIGLDFTNVYKASGTLELFGTKELIGKNLTKDMFKFLVKDANDQTVLQGSNDADGKVAFTGKLTYTAADIGKTFIYTVREDDTSLPSGYSMVGTNSHTLIVQAVDGGSGKLSITAYIDESTVTGTSVNKASGGDGVYTVSGNSGLDFHNKYAINEISTNLTAYKSVNGNTDLSLYQDANPEFKFSLYEAVYNAGGKKITKGREVTGQTGKPVNLTSHSVTFENITYGAESLWDPESGKYVDDLTKYYLIEEDTLASDTSDKHFTQGGGKVAVKVELSTKDGVLGGTVFYAQVASDGTVGEFGTEISNATINNTYTDSLSVNLSGKVELDSVIRDMADQSFTVQVSGGKLNSPAEFTVGGSGISDNIKSIDYGSGSAAFTFDQTDAGKSYEYTVTQTKMLQNGTAYTRSGGRFGQAEGYTADTNTYKIKMTIGVDTDGNLKADYQILDQSDKEISKGTFTSDGKDTADGTITGLDFKNKYEASVDIRLKENTTFRAVNGTDTTVQDWLDANSQTGFAYKVYAINTENGAPDESSPIAYGSSAKIDFPAQPVDNVQDSSKLQTTPGSPAQAAALYQTDKDYTDQKSALGVFYYYVEQTVPEGAENYALAGLTYGSDDVHAYVVKAEVTDDPAVNGQLKVTYSYKANKSQALWSEESTEIPVLGYMNSYAASGTVTLKGTKTLNRRNMAANEFTFTLKQTTASDKNAAVSSLGATVLSTGNPAANAGVKSEAFQWTQENKNYTDFYTSVGEYTYLTEEETGSLPEGVTPVQTQSSETLTVKVTDNHKGELETKVTGSAAQDETADFVNTYGSSGGISISGKKTVNGNPVTGYAYNQFKFQLYEDTGNNSYNIAVGAEAESDVSTGIFTITDSYTQEDMLVDGSYRTEVLKTYFLKETKAVQPDDHYTMGGNQYLITVTLKDDQRGKITAYISEIKDVTGKQPSEWSEVSGASYDNGAISRILDKAADEDDLTFNNTYSVNANAEISGKKTDSGFTLTADKDSVELKQFNHGHFAFLLYNCKEDGTVAADAQPIDIAELKDDGSFAFDSLTFRYMDGTGQNGDDTGTHYFKIVEAQPGKTYTEVKDPHLQEKEPTSLTTDNVPDMKYSDEAYVMKIVVAYDPSTGRLTAAPSLSGGPDGGKEAVFTNTYATGAFTIGGNGISVVSAYEAAPGTSTTYGESNVKYAYTMTPVDQDGKELTALPTGITADTKNMSDETYTASTPVDADNKNAVSAKVTFKEQTVHNTEDRYYKIAQTVASGSNPGITFEEGYYIIKVATSVDPSDQTKLNSTVSEITYYNKDGKQVQTLDPATDTICFTNVYHADPIKLSFQTTKVLTGRYMFAGEFGFTLAGQAGTGVYGYTAYSDTQSNTAAAADTVNTITFKEDTLNGVGIYSYTLRENASQKASVTDDTTEYRKEIEVEDNHTGKLVFAANSGVTAENGTEKGTYSFDGQKAAGKAAAYVNTYTSSYESTDPASGGLVLKGTKTINGLAVNDTYETKDRKDNATYQNRENEFSFTLTETDADGNVLMKDAIEKKFETTAAADGEGSFRLTIPYTQADMKTADGNSGDFKADGITAGAADTQAGGSGRKSQTVYHYYQLSEDSTKDGYGKSDKTYQIKVALTDNYDGTISASVAEVQDRTGGSIVADKALAFDNTYKANGSIILKGTKLTKGFGLNEPDTYVYAEEFKFELYESDQDGRYAKDAVPLQTTALDTKEEDGRTEYQNTFTFAPISYELKSGQKDVGDHYYVIRETEGSTKGMVYDTREYLVRVTVSDAGKGKLTAVVSDISQLTEHKFLLFQWTETAKAEDVLSFTNVYQSGGIDLYASNRYVAENGTDTPLEVLNQAQGDDSTTFRFEMNLSNADGELVDTSGLEGLKLSETKTRSYQDNDYTMPTALADGGTEEATTFDFLHMKQNDLNILKEWLHDLNFHSTGKFYIRMDQVLPEEKADGVTYDTGYYLAEITVTEPEADDNGDASDALKAWISSVSYYNAEGKLQNTVTDEAALNEPKTLAETIVFTNVYRAEDTGLAFQTEKVTDNRSMKAEEFHFIVSGTEFWTTDGELVTTITASNEAAAAGKAAAVVFERMIFDGIGTYHYSLAEKEEGLGGIVYDSAVYTFTVEVTDDHEGALHSAVTSLTRDGEELLEEAVPVSDEKEAVTVLSDYITFSNHYTTGSASVALDGTKTINGRSVELFRNNLFTFDLFPAEYEGGIYTASGEAVDTAVSDIRDGSFRLEAEFDQDDLFTEGGEGERIWNQKTDHYFIITERTPEDTGYRTNDASVGVTVTLTDNLDGTLTAEITDMKVQGSGAATADGYESDRGSVHFDNVYKAEGELALTGSKQMQGAELADLDAFIFEIVDEAGNVTGTAANEKDGKILFTIPCDESFIGETRTFTLREVNDERSGVSYDETEYQLNVTAWDGGNGTLSLTAELLLEGSKADTAAFVNIFRSKKKRGSGSGEAVPAAVSQQNRIVNPKTGDETGMFGYMLMLMASACGILTVERKRRKKNMEGK